MAIFFHLCYYYSLLSTIAIFFMFQDIEVAQCYACYNLFYLSPQVILFWYSFILLFLINYHHKIFYLSFQVIWSNVNLYYCLILFQFYFIYPFKLIYLMFLYTIVYYYYFNKLFWVVGFYGNFFRELMLIIKCYI